MAFVTKKYNYFRLLMLLVNIILVVFLLLSITNAIYLICNNFLARSFIEYTKNIQLAPKYRIEIIIILLLILLINIVLREIYMSRNKKIIYFICILDIIISMLIIYNINFSYKGILFLTFANIIYYVDNNILKYVLCSITIAVFVLFDYSIVSYFFNIVSLDYLTEYYEKSQKLMIYTTSNILSSINEILLFLFMIAVVQEQVNENKIINNLYNKLKNANIELENYAKLSEETAKIKERNRLAREIHDTVGHTLTGISVGLQASITLLDNDKDLAKEYISKIQHMARDGLNEVRRSVHELKVDTIEQYSLIPAIEKMAEDMEKVSNIKIYLHVSGEYDVIMKDTENAIYKVIKESITNTLKHSNGNEVNIYLTFKDDLVNLKILDNGSDFKDFNKGFGLSQIEQRIVDLKGKVIFIGNTNKGFCVNVSIPLFIEVI